MKKVLSLVLVLTLVLGSFSMAFAAETTETNLSDIAGDSNEDAIEVANDLGIIDGYPDGTFKPDNNVTRAEFAKMMTKALAIPESALKGFTASTFKDVDNSHWAVSYLGYCNSKGIMTGYEDGTARPNQTITVNEAITMICRALGYTSNAKQLVGTWPANYIALGQTLNLYKDVEATAITDRGSAAQIVYNALKCDLVYIDNDGTTCQVNGVSTPMITLLGGVKYVPATPVNAAEGSFILTTAIAKQASININQYVGQLCTAYCDRDDATAIIALEVLSTTLEGDFEAPETFTVDDVEYIVEHVDAAEVGTNALANWGYGANNANLPLLVDNGQCVAANTSGGGLVDGESYTLAVKLNGKTITEIYSVFTEDVADLFQFEAGDLDVEKRTLDGVEFSRDKNGEIDKDSFTLIGVSSLDKIAEGNVVEIYTVDGLTTGKINKVVVGTKTITGTCTEITKKKDGTTNDKYVIDGTKYASVNETPELGDTGTAYLNYDGKIAYWEASAATAGNYGVFLGYEDSTSFGETTTTVKLVTNDGKTAKYDLASSPKFVDETVAPVGTSATLAGWVAGPEIVKYALNSKGDQITKITKVQAAATLNGTISRSKKAIGNDTVASNVLVFMNDSGDWSLIDLKSVDDTYAFSTEKYAANSKGDVAAFMIDKDNALGDNTSYGLITGISTKNNANGSEKTWITGFIDGKAFEAYADATGLIKSAKGFQGLYMIKMDSEGTVTVVTKPATTTTTVALDGSYIPALDAPGAVVKSVDKESKEIVLDNNKRFGLTSDVVVYFYGKDGYEVSNVNAIKKDYNIEFFQTDNRSNDDVKHGLYDIVIFWK